MTTSRARKTAAAAVLTALPDPQKEASQVQSDTGLKPFVIDMENLSLGDLEFMESLSELEAAGKNPGTKQLFELFTRFFEGWTIEDCRKIKIGQVQEVKQQLFAALKRAVPNEKGITS
jgi:hypothetical protein